jgi:hypothetical protein
MNKQYCKKYTLLLRNNEFILPAFSSSVKKNRKKIEAFPKNLSFWKASFISFFIDKRGYI